MSLDDLSKKLKQYYNKISNPSLFSGVWIIADENLYNKLKGKLKITSINFINTYPNEVIVVAETKEGYYAIKYNENFICLRPSKTEYGLLMGDYKLVAVNKKITNHNYDTKLENRPSFQQICKDMGWPLSKKAKEYIDYNK